MRPRWITIAVLNSPASACNGAPTTIIGASVALARMIRSIAAATASVSVR
jgi:hypothetical protein